jgi:hypothetical protein
MVLERTPRAMLRRRQHEKWLKSVRENLRR